MFFSEQRNQLRSFTRRSVLLLGIKSGLFAFVSWKLFNLQILESKKYRTLSKNNQINLKITFPIRGLIFDRNGNIIANNYTTYGLFVIPEQTKDLENLLIQLSEIVNIDFKNRKKIIALSKKVKKYEMIKIYENLKWTDLEKIQSDMYKFSGLQIITSKKRYYPYANYFSHIIGYTSLPSKDDLSLPYIKEMPSLDIGRSGVEKVFNKLLIGIPGSREVEVDVMGREIREIRKLESKNGKKQNILSLQVNKSWSGNSVLA